MITQDSLQNTSGKLMVDASHLSFGYEILEGHRIDVLHDVSLQIKDGESVGVIGANGVGKSTLLKILVGLNPCCRGELHISGIPMTKDNLPRIREKLGYVFQDSDSQLFMSTVYQDVAFAPRNYGCSEEEVEKRVTEALEQVHIMHLRDKHTYRLSGGEKKLASIATILSMRPELILMDEPSVALDPKNRRNLIRLLKEFHVTKLIASHDLDMIYDTCDRTVLLHEGRIIRDAKTEEILTDRDLLETYGLELPLSLSGRM